MGSSPPPRDATRITEDTVESVIRERLSAALGGLRGSVESALPMMAFVVAWLWRHDVRMAVAASGAVLLVLLMLRLAARSTPRYVLTAVLPTAAAGFFALRSGRAEAAFLPGLLWNGALCLACLLSVAARWPIVGFVVAAGDPHLAEDPTAWRRDPGLVHVCQRLTLVLVALFAARLIVMGPLYAAGQVTLLGVAKLVLGWPAYLAAVAVMAALLVRGRTPTGQAPVP